MALRVGSGGHQANWPKLLGARAWEYAFFFKKRRSVHTIDTESAVHVSILWWLPQTHYKAFWKPMITVKQSSRNIALSRMKLEKFQCSSSWTQNPFGNSTPYSPQESRQAQHCNSRAQASISLTNLHLRVSARNRVRTSPRKHSLAAHCC